MGSLQVQLTEKNIKGEKRSDDDTFRSFLFYGTLLLIEKKKIKEC